MVVCGMVHVEGWVVGLGGNGGSGRLVGCSETRWRERRTRSVLVKWKKHGSRMPCGPCEVSQHNQLLPEGRHHGRKVCLRVVD